MEDLETKNKQKLEEELLNYLQTRVNPKINKTIETWNVALEFFDRNILFLSLPECKKYFLSSCIYHRTSLSR
jgi:hypothetical protein